MERNAITPKMDVELLTIVAVLDAPYMSLSLCRVVNPLSVEQTQGKQNRVKIGDYVLVQRSDAQFCEWDNPTRPETTVALLLDVDSEAAALEALRERFYNEHRDIQAEVLFHQAAYSLRDLPSVNLSARRASIKECVISLPYVLADGTVTHVDCDQWGVSSEFEGLDFNRQPGSIGSNGGVLHPDVTEGVSSVAVMWYEANSNNSASITTRIAHPDAHVIQVGVGDHFNWYGFKGWAIVSKEIADGYDLFAALTGDDEVIEIRPEGGRTEYQGRYITSEARALLLSNKYPTRRVMIGSQFAGQPQTYYIGGHQMRDAR